MASPVNDAEVVRDAPSFRLLGDGHAFLHFNDSPQIISAAIPRSHDESLEDGYVDAGDGYSDDGTEFAFDINAPEFGPRIAADDIFSDRRVLPVYPVFGRRLLRSGNEETLKDEDRAIRKQLEGISFEDQEETNPSSEEASSPWELDWEDVNELDGIPPESYCKWTPGSAPRTPDRCTKSSSTGSTMRWRLRDLLGRSHSDGKEKFVFLDTSEKKIKEKNKVGKEKKKTPPLRAAACDAEKIRGKNVKKETVNGGKVTDVGTSQRNSNAKARKPAGGGGRGRRSYLPYRQEIIGIFAGMNGLSRTYQPY